MHKTQNKVILKHMCFGITRTTLGNMTKAEKYTDTSTLYTISGDSQTLSNSVWKFNQSAQLLSRLWLFATPWTAARQASQSITNSPEFAQTHVHRVSNAIQPSHPLSSPSPPTFNLSQIQGLFQESVLRIRWPKDLEFQLQHQSFQWIFRTDCL